MDVAVYTIDDKKYLLLNKKEYNDNTYLFFAKALKMQALLP